VVRDNLAVLATAQSGAGFHVPAGLLHATLRETVEYKKYMCIVCGWIYDEETGAPEEGLEPGTRWDDVPLNWMCPDCGATKEDFDMVEID